MLSKANSVTLVETDRAGEIRGYALVLFHRGTPLARLYSIAVAPRWRSKGIGRLLMRAAEEAARDRDAAYLRLEVRADDVEAQELYKRLGYRPFGIHSPSYEDETDAVRLDQARSEEPRGGKKGGRR